MQRNVITVRGAFYLFNPLFLLTLLCFFSGLVFNCSAYAKDIVFIQPGMGETLIAKRPEIKCSFPFAFAQATLFVAVDKTDVTALAKMTDTGFSLKLFHPLPAGDHTILVTVIDQNNQLHKQQIEFATRHSQMFETLASKNTLSAGWSQVVKKMNDAKSRSISDWEFESNLSSDNIIGQGPWQVSFKTNARYSDQQLGITDPLQKGFHLMDYLFKGEMDADPLNFYAAIGDVSVEGTKNTIGSLSRRGISIGADSKTIFVNGFSLKSQQTFGLDDSEDVEPDNDDHLLGFAAGARLLDEKLKLTTTYVNGGEKSGTSSYNTWPEPGETQGDALGLEIQTDFFNNKFATRFEADWSDYDGNTKDAAGSKTDKAYLAQITGIIDFLNYDVLYEYIGSDYKVATSSLQQDRKGFTIKSGITGTGQSLNLNLGKYNDNLDRDTAKPRLDTLQYGATYALSKISFLPLTLGWQRSFQDSSLEPLGSSEIKSETDTFFGSVSYIKNAFVIGLQPEYTQMNDKSAADYDTRSGSLTLFSTYNRPRFSISPSVSANRFEDQSLNAKRDTISCNLSFSANLVDGLDLQGSLAYGMLNSNDHSINQDNFAGDLQLSYSWQEPIGNIFSPTIQLLATHDNSSDKVADTGTNETVIYLIFSGSLDLSF